MLPFILVVSTIFHFKFQMFDFCSQNFPDITNRTAALMYMPKGRYQYLKRLIPLLVNQSEDCLTLNIYVPGSGKCDIQMLFMFCVKKKSKNRFHDDGKRVIFCPGRQLKLFRLWLLLLLFLSTLSLSCFIYIYSTFGMLQNASYSINKTSHYCNIHESSSTHNAKCRFSSRQTSYSLQRHKIIFFS